jgi:hypothetical protein
VWRSVKSQSPSRHLRAAALVSAVLVGSGVLLASGAARAGFDGGGGGAENHNDFDADKSEIYQVIRGDLVCNSREACGGAAAIPMNRPGWFYLPGGMFLKQQGLLPSPNAPYASYIPKRKHPTRR